MPSQGLHTNLTGIITQMQMRRSFLPFKSVWPSAWCKLYQSDSVVPAQYVELYIYISLLRSFETQWPPNPVAHQFGRLDLRVQEKKKQARSASPHAEKKPSPRHIWPQSSDGSEVLGPQSSDTWAMTRRLAGSESWWSNYPGLIDVDRMSCTGFGIRHT